MVGSGVGGGVSHDAGKPPHRGGTVTQPGSIEAQTAAAGGGLSQGRAWVSACSAAASLAVPAM